MTYRIIRDGVRGTIIACLLGGSIRYALTGHRLWALAGAVAIAYLVYDWAS